MKNAHAIKTGSSREKDHMTDPDIDGNIILYLNLEIKIWT
jgi:hypothetical protein